MVKRRRRKRKKRDRRELGIEELKAILERAKTTALSAEEHEKLESAIDTLAFLTREIEAKGASIRRLRNLLFGPSSEKTSQVVARSSAQEKGKSGESVAGAAASADASAGVSSSPEGFGGRGAESEEKREKKKRKGHGRNSAAAYRGAEKVKVPHARLQHKDHCPECQKGKLYLQKEPRNLVRVVGMAPLSATVYELERLRCNLCGEVLTADSPEGVGDEKYDETAAAMLGLLKYGCGFPFNRLEWLETSLGIPLPASTQWEVVSKAAELLEPAHTELVLQAAQGEVIHNDDTTMKILDLNKPRRQGEEEASDGKFDGRTGIFTTGIVSIRQGNRIALFFTGRQHAGENLADVLGQRAAELGPPIQMCDALPANTAGDFETLLANCMAHARRKFVEVADNFPDECRHVLEAVSKVYCHDAQAREKEMSPQQRLSFHQARSGPLMDELQKWFEQQLEQRKVEPNSGLGKAANYMQKHWVPLTLFLRQPGAPLDNNAVERSLKKAILHRKNALFYKTGNGARVGDLYMSLIYSAELAGANPFDYLVALQRHHLVVSENPGQWMPWNYKEALGRLAPQPARSP